MAAFESLVSVIGTWFGFVGSCVAGAGSACRPFLAFVALAAAAGAALALLVMAYRAMQKEHAGPVDLRRTEAHELPLHARVRMAPNAMTATQRAGARAWQATAEV